MKRNLFATFIVSALLNIGYTQSSDYKLSLGVHTGLTDYHGELNQSWFNASAYRANFGLSGMYYLNKWLNTGLGINYGSIGHHVPESGGFRAKLLHANAQLRFKINNGVWLEENSRFQPYVFLGTGMASYTSDGNSQLVVAGYDWTGNTGFGFNVMATDRVGFNYHMNYVLSNHDKRDGVSVGANDQFVQHSLGIVFHLGKMIDTDGDGVSDKRDKCLGTPAGVKVDLLGCPLDSDNDGVADYVDECPFEKGTLATKGCPDSDGDGIIDANDECPELAGVLSANGCPDADGDGVKDAVDQCPNVKGLPALNGCPDSDGDGITDSEDLCPTVKGLIEFKGCPDTDGDGIPDNIDKCPKVPGVAINNGCPEIKAETIKVFERALKGIQFETGKDVIKTQSFSILNNVVSIMKDNPSYKLQINGHTDNQGDDDKNQLLSEARAKSVMNYLINNGIEANRLSSAGFGESQPKASNDSAEGRAINRRVEFVINFE